MMRCVSDCKTWLAAMALCASGALHAQTMNIVSGQVTYRAAAGEMGKLTLESGSILNLMGKRISVSEFSRAYISGDAVEPNTVSVSYNGSEASVVCSADQAQYLDITVSGADVSIQQHDDLATEITYVLSGTSTDGSFTMDGSLKATVMMDDLSLTKLTQAPVNILNGKRINLELSGTNVLRDGASSSGKGALMVNGHTEITGDGTLTLYGYAKHGFWADEYVQLKKSFTGTLAVAYAAADGLNVNDYLEMNGGTINVSGQLDDGIAVSADSESGYVLLQGGTMNITSTAAGCKGLKADGSITFNEDKNTLSVNISNSGAATYDATDAEVKGTACVSSDAHILINGGTITLSATGKGGKGMKCDSTFTMNAGTVSLSTTGTRYTYGSDGSSPKALKVGIKGSTQTGHLQINGGVLTASASGQADGSEAIESKNTITLSGGTVTASSYDDAVNSAKRMNIEGGTLTVVSANNDGLDSNADLYVSGGVVMAFGSRAPECSIDAAEGYNVYLNGGVVLGVGGSSFSPSSSSSQAWVTSSSSVSASQTIKLASGSTVLATFTVPSNYSGSSSTGGTWGGGHPGGGSSGSQVLLSAPGVSSGSSYTLTIGTTSTTVSGTKSGSTGGRW